MKMKMSLLQLAPVGRHLLLRAGAGLLLLAMLVICPFARAQTGSGDPATEREVVAAAKREGRVVVFGATDVRVAHHLIRDFEDLYPGVVVDYQLLRSTDLYNRFVSEVQAGKPSADVVWGPAMDLMIKLVNDGYARAYRSPEARNLPDWAVWRDEAYGTTYEPIVLVYNKRLVAQADVPQTRAELLRLITTQRARFSGKIVTYDAEKYGFGFLLATQDHRSMNGSWELLRAMGAANLGQAASTAIMLGKIASGEYLIGYNLLGSYVAERAQLDPALGYVLLRDYTLVLSRIAFVSKASQQPNAARLWVDYLLSRRGQAVMATRAGLHALRTDIDGEFSAKSLMQRHGGSIKPISVGPALLYYQDHTNRRKFLQQWRNAVGRP
jgi:iron(III) transport system substrate-binding protein